MIAISDTLRGQERKEAELYPELNQGLKIVSENGEIILTRKKSNLLLLLRDILPVRNNCITWPVVGKLDRSFVLITGRV